MGGDEDEDETEEGEDDDETEDNVAVEETDDAIPSDEEEDDESEEEEENEAGNETSDAETPISIPPPPPVTMQFEEVRHRNSLKLSIRAVQLEVFSFVLEMCTLLSELFYLSFIFLRHQVITFIV